MSDSVVVVPGGVVVVANASSEGLFFILLFCAYVHAAVIMANNNHKNTPDGAGVIMEAVNVNFDEEVVVMMDVVVADDDNNGGSSGLLSSPQKSGPKDPGDPAGGPPSMEESIKIGRFFCDPKRIPPQHSHRLGEISPFYTDEMILELLVPVIEQTYDVSLRALDWTVVNWSKKHRIVCKVDTGQGKIDVVNIFNIYKDVLKRWRRRMFDPFRRRDRVYFHHPVTKLIYSTTVGQLNFLRWAKVYGVIDQTRAHLQQIEHDMVTTLNESKRRRQDERAVGAKRKRTELTPAPRGKCQVYMLSHDVDFD